MSPGRADSAAVGSGGGNAGRQNREKLDDAFAGLGRFGGGLCAEDGIRHGAELFAEFGIRIDGAAILKGGVDALVVVVKGEGDGHAEQSFHLGGRDQALAVVAVEDDADAVGEVAGVPESLIFADARQACLSAWGTALLEQVRARAYRERLQPPAVPELVFSERFEREAGRLGKDDLAKLNRQLDALARWVATDGRHNPSSLDVKKLAKPVDGSTHQVDAWSGTGKRLFGRFEDGKFVIDRLGDHL
mgnify:CR=1 FL=1